MLCTNLLGIIIIIAGIRGVITGKTIMPQDIFSKGVVKLEGTVAKRNAVLQIILGIVIIWFGYWFTPS